MKISRRIMTIALVLLLAASLFAGCKTSVSDTTVSEEPESTSASETATEPETTGIVFPLEEKVTLTMWAPLTLNASKAMSDLNGSLVFQELEEITNVHIEFIHPAIGQEAEQFNLMIASGEYPDMILGAVTYYKGGADRAIEDGVYIPLNDMVEEYAPNYYALANQSDLVRKQVTSDSGVMTAIYPILAVDNPCWHGLTIRKDWLDETGLAVPVTLDDWTELLAAIKANHPDSTPLIFDFIGPTTQRFKTSGTDAFGLFLSSFNLGPYFYNDDETVKFGPYEDNFLEYLTLMNSWYEAGYIDLDFPARDRDSITSMVASGQVGAFAASVDYANNIFSSQGIEYVAAPYPVLNEGDQLNYRAGDFTASPDSWATAITTSCENPEIALAWLDYAFGEEGSMLFNYGVEGETYEMVEGIPTFTDLVMKNPEYSVEVCIFLYKMHIFPQLRYGAYANPASLVNPAVLNIKESWTQAVTMDMNMPPVSLTADEGTDFATIMNTVDVYRNEMTIKFIMGIEPLSKFEEYQEQLKEMQIEDAIAIEQAALDRFNNR